MSKTDYLIIGSSHAGLAAMDNIRMRDGEGIITMITRENCLPYSPTVLPYIISGEAEPENIFLRTQDFFDANNVRLIRGSAVTRLDTHLNKALLDSGEEIEYGKALIASGASPSIPPIPSLEKCRYYVLRTLDDALKIRDTMKGCPSATILGGGLIGMHAAENLAKAGLNVTLVEMLLQVLPGYFDSRAASLIQKTFTRNGVRILTGKAVTHVTASNSAYVVSLENGLDLSAHLLLVATGVKTNTDFLSDSRVEVDQGVLVDPNMQTSVENVWAAGDVAQAGSFLAAERSLTGILPDAVTQGRIAGTAMAGGTEPHRYRGGMPMNTYSFFGNRSFSAGLTLVPEETDEYQVDLVVSPSRTRYRKMVFKDDHLVGVSSINSELDPGIFSELILRKIDLSPYQEDLVNDPVNTGRFIMSATWR